MLSKGKILDMYSMILPAGNAQVFVDQIFRIFDKDGNGSIDFKVRMKHVDKGSRLHYVTKSCDVGHMTV